MILGFEHVCMKIAVVGSGIAGLGAAWALSQRHEVMLFEAAGRLGGHANTVEVETPDGNVDVDTGFVVYNELTSPNLVRLFDTLEVLTQPSDISFSFSVENGLEYRRSLGAVIARPQRLISRRYRRMMADIVRFRGAVDDAEIMPSRLTLGTYLRDEGYSDGFIYDYLVPLAATIWSARPRQIVGFPAAATMRFLTDHGFVKLHDRRAWQTVSGGSQRYVEKIAEHLGDSVRLRHRVRSVQRFADCVTVATDGGVEAFDHVVLAIHGDQALSVLGEGARLEERSVLGAIRYEDNVAVLHADSRLMPRSRRVWSAWNHMATSERSLDRRVSVTFWMNRLQSLRTSTDLFVSLNPLLPPDRVVASFEYSQPQYDVKALDALQRLPTIQGRNRTWFAGAWCGYGSHEDGLQSGLDVAAALGSPARWRGEVSPAGSAAPVEPMSEVEW